MKATLEFDLPEEQSEFDLCCDATKLSIVISELNNELRNHLKYEEIERIIMFTRQYILNKRK